MSTISSNFWTRGVPGVPHVPIAPQLEELEARVAPGDVLNGLLAAVLGPEWLDARTDTPSSPSPSDKPALTPAGPVTSREVDSLLASLLREARHTTSYEDLHTTHSLTTGGPDFDTLDEPAWVTFAGVFGAQGDEASTFVTPPFSDTAHSTEGGAGAVDASFGVTLNSSVPVLPATTSFFVPPPSSPPPQPPSSPEGGGGNSLLSLPVVTVTATDGSAAEYGPDSGTFTFTRSDATGELDVVFEVAGSADEYGDYSGITNDWPVVHFAAGQSSVTVTVSPFVDADAEGDETVIVTLLDGELYDLGTPFAATITIQDNTLPVVEVFATDDVATETLPGDPADEAIFTFYRSDTTGPLTVNYTIDGLATGGTDYQALTGTVTFADGSDSATVAVTPFDDSLPEGLESVDITLTASASYAVGMNSEAIALLDDNDAPNAYFDFYSIKHDTTLELTSDEGVLWNDWHAGAAPLTATLLTSPTHGAFTFASDGSFTYTPTPGFVGEDSFTYRADADGVQGNETTVFLDVTNVAPITGSAEYSVRADTSLVVDHPGLMAWTSDEDDYFPSFVLEDGPDQGTLILGSEGTFTYTPNAGYIGSDSFSYRAFDGAAYSGIGYIDLTVYDQAPTTTADAFFVPRNGSLSIGQANVLLNDYDRDGDAVTAQLIAGPGFAAQFALNADGTFTYTPLPGYVGVDTFTYRAFDGTLGGDTVSVTLTVTDRAVGRADHYTRPASGQLVVAVNRGLLSNDFLMPGAGATVQLVQPPSGVLVLNPNGSFTYTPPGGNGVDTFSYVIVQPGKPTSAPVTVTIHPQAPAVTLESLSFLNGHPLISDDGTEPERMPVWTPASGAPLAYTKDSDAKVQAIFTVADPSRFQGGAVVRGTGGGMEFLGTARLDRDNKLVLAEATWHLADAIDYFEPLLLTWEVLPAQGANPADWVQAGVSSNEFYVLGGGLLRGEKVWRTAAWIGTNFLKGKDADTSAKKVDEIWKAFAKPTGANAGKPPEVKRKDGEVLYYYGSWHVTENITRIHDFLKIVTIFGGEKPGISDTPQTGASLLKYRDGDCVAWTRFLLDVLKAQGVSQTDNFYVAKSRFPTDNSILVNNWKILVANGSNKNPKERAAQVILGNITYTLEYKYVNTWSNSFASDLKFYKAKSVPNPFPYSYLYGWDFGRQTKDVKDEPGIPGQGNPNPASAFSNHVLAQLTGTQGTKLYDPSYGTIFENVEKLDNQAVAFYANVAPVLNRAGTKVIGMRMILRENPTGQTDLIRDSNQPTKY